MNITAVQYWNSLQRFQMLNIKFEVVQSTLCHVTKSTSRRRSSLFSSWPSEEYARLAQPWLFLDARSEVITWMNESAIFSCNRVSTGHWKPGKSRILIHKILNLSGEFQFFNSEKWSSIKFLLFSVSHFFWSPVISFSFKPSYQMCSFWTWGFF